MDNFGWDIISYFFMCALSIAASPQNQDNMRVSISKGYALPYATTTVIKRQGGVYKLKRWSREGGVEWSVIRSEIVTDLKGRKYTRYNCQDGASRRAFTLPHYVPNFNSVNIKTANAALLKLRDERTTIKMRRDGKIVNFAPSPVTPRDLHIRSKRLYYRSRWSVIY